MDLQHLFTYLIWPLLSFTATYLLLSLFKPATKARNLPPGPAGWPIIGNLLQLSRNPHRTLAELAATYGPIMSLRLGGKITVVISSASATKELIQSYDATLRDRELFDAVTAQNHHELSVIWMAGGPKWRNLRKISNAHLFSNKSLDSSRTLREKKVNDLISHVQACCDDVVSVDIGQAAFHNALNFMSNSIFSIDLADTDSHISREFKQLIGRISAEFCTPNLADVFPVFKVLDPQGIRRRMNRYLRHAMDLVEALIDQRLDHLHINGRQFDDILETLLRISRDPDSGIDCSSIVHLIMDLFSGGTETTGNTIEWAMAELIRNPDKMRKAREEIHRVIGKGEMVSETDISSLPYLQAVVKETLRLHPPIPLISRKNTDSDLVLSGFTVPKSSRVWINLWGIGRDPKVWGNPKGFEPERFLESEIDIRGRDFEVIPFGSGRRICVGMAFALRIVPLTVGSLINSFDWKLENGVGGESLNMDEKFGITLQKVVPLRAIPIRL